MRYTGSHDPEQEEAVRTSPHCCSPFSQDAQDFHTVISRAMEPSELSLLSSLRGDDFKSEDLVAPHYREAYRLAIDRLVDRGRDGYQEFLKEERVGNFLSDQELLFISENAEQLSPPDLKAEEDSCVRDSHSSSGTYWPLDSDTDAPDLDLGWPQVRHDLLQTNIDLLFHPPRQNSHTIKEVVRKNIQEARQVRRRTRSIFMNKQAGRPPRRSPLGVIHVGQRDFTTAAFLLRVIFS